MPGCKDRKRRLRGATGGSRKGLGRRRGRHGSRSVWPIITLSRTSRCLSPGWLRALQPLKRGWGPLADAQRGRAGDGRTLRAWVAATASPAGHSQATDGRRNATTLVSSSHYAVRRRAVGHWRHRGYCREHPTAPYGTLRHPPAHPSSLQLPPALTSLYAHPPTTSPTAPCPADLQPLCKGSRPRHWALAVQACAPRAPICSSGRASRAGFILASPVQTLTTGGSAPNLEFLIPAPIRICHPSTDRTCPSRS